MPSNGIKRWLVRRSRRAVGVDALSVDLAALAEELRSRADAADAASHELHELLDAISAAHHETRELALRFADRWPEMGARLEDHERKLRVRAVMDWIDALPGTASSLVSVVLPTRDRAELLGRAAASVLGQSHARWEMLIIDDASEDETPDVIAALVAGDDRIRSYTGSGRGACAARNLALDNAKGDIVVYLDDDNLMHPNWLKSVVWAFQQRSDVDVLYGAIVVDDPARLDGRSQGGEPPQMYFHQYDHDEVTQHNIADMGVIAHRAGLAEAHFDESLREMGDWDLFVRLTRPRAPLALPAVACFYTTDAWNRLTGGPTASADLDAVRAKHRST